jgi:hypothetical protein
MASSTDHIFWDVKHFTTHSFRWCVSYFTLASQTRHAVASHPIWGGRPDKPAEELKVQVAVERFVKGAA